MGCMAAVVYVVNAKVFNLNVNSRCLNMEELMEKIENARLLKSLLTMQLKSQLLSFQIYLFLCSSVGVKSLNGCKYL